MKRFFAATLIAFAALGAAAQSTIVENVENAPYFGFRVGIDVSSVSDGSDVYSNGAGFTLGAIYNIPLWANMYFEPGLYMFYDTVGQQAYNYADDDYSGLVDGSLRNFGFRAPFNFGYRFDFTGDISIAVFTGPILNLSLKATDHWNQPLKSDSNLFDRGFKHVDLQWGFGASFAWQKYFVQISGGAGITKLRSFQYPEAIEDIHYRRNNLTIAIGYNF